jgi:hypothetical protein
VNYLFSDCTETLLKFKQVMRPGGGGDATVETAAAHAVTLPEHHEQLECELTLTAAPDSVMLLGDAHLAASSADITLQEEDDELMGGGGGFGFNDEELIEMDEFEEDEANAAARAAGGSTRLDEAPSQRSHSHAGRDAPAAAFEPEEEHTLELMDMDEMLEADEAEAAARGVDAGAEGATTATPPAEDDDIEVERFRDAAAVGAAGLLPTPLRTPGGYDAYDHGLTPGGTPLAAPLSALQLALGMATPASRAGSFGKDPFLATPALSLGLPSPAGVGAGDEAGGLAGITVRQFPAARAARVVEKPRKASKRKLVAEPAVHGMLSNEEIRQQLKSSAPLLRARQPMRRASAVVRR